MNVTGMVFAMRSRVFVACMLVFAACIAGGAAAAAPDIEWSYKFGGSGIGTLHYGCIAATADGGSIFAGESDSQDGNITNPIGGYDIVLLKQDADGGIEWQKNVGGTNDDTNPRVHQTSDGGYILSAETRSNDTDVSGLHANFDIWVVKLTGSGSIEWQRCLGGSHLDENGDVLQTSDDGYIVVGRTASTDGDVTDRVGGTYDAWVVKLNATGGIEWKKCIGRDGEGEGTYSVIETSDGHYVVAGNSNIDGQWDALVAKLDATGGLVWDSYFGGTARDEFMGGSDDAEAFSVIEDADGDYLVVGNIILEDPVTHDDHRNVWLAKVSAATGADLWEKTFGGSRTEYGENIIRTSDGGYAIGATASSSDGDVTDIHGTYPASADYWVVKLDSSYTIEWQKCLGGTAGDVSTGVAQTTDGGYVCTGYTRSTDGDVPPLTYGSNFIFWTVKLAPETPAGPPVPAAPPVCASPAASPGTIPTDTDGSAGWGENAALSVNVTGGSTITSVAVDLSSIGGSSSAAMTGSGSVWSVTTNASTASPFSGGAYQPVDLTVNATDAVGQTNTTVITLTVITNGDVNEDNNVSLPDAQYLARSVLGIPGYTMHANVADVSGDGAASLYDAVYLARHAIGVSGYETLH